MSAPRRLRSGSIDTDKNHLSVVVGRSRARSFSAHEETDKKKDKKSSKGNKKNDMDSLKFVLSSAASHQITALQNSVLTFTPDANTLSSGELIREQHTETGDKKTHRRQPDETFEYSVVDGDTLEGIAARFDVIPSEIMKTSRLLSRTVFAGQTLYIPNSSNTIISPVVSPTQLDYVVINLPQQQHPQSQDSFRADVAKQPPTDNKRPKPVDDKQEKFLKIPVRRVLDEDQKLSGSEGCTVKGTLLVTPVSIMFDPNVSDPIVISFDDPKKFSAAIYMEELKSVAIFHDHAPRLFWKQPKELRKRSTKPAPYRSGQESKDEGHGDVKENTSVSTTDDTKDEVKSNVIVVIDGEDTVGDGGGILEEQEGKQHHTAPQTQQRRLSDKPHNLTSSNENPSNSTATKTQSGSSKEYHGENTSKFGENLDIGPQRQRSSSAIHIDYPPAQPPVLSDHSLATKRKQFSSKNRNENHNTANSNINNNTQTANSISTNHGLHTDFKTNIQSTQDNSEFHFSKSNDLEDLEHSGSESSRLLDKPDKPNLKQKRHSSSSVHKQEQPKTMALNKLMVQLSNRSWVSDDQQDGSIIGLSSSVSSPLRLKNEFKREDISKVLGPDPKRFMMRSDSFHFKEAPFYLQIRRGIRKNVEILQPRAFDHWNTGPLLHEYWFVVPRDMGDKLYKFLMTWQPDAYGDEEETATRGKFFFDIPVVNNVLEDSYHNSEKSWEILSQKEAFGALKGQQVHRQNTIDENNFPELIGTSVIITNEHIYTILRSLPWSMSIGYNWELVYATHKHGYSLQNMYMKTELVDSDVPVLLFIMDTYGTIFGGYLSSTVKTSEVFYGTGSTFLFTFYPEFKKFAWSGDNEMFMHGTREFFAVGNDEGQFGLWLDGSLDKGRSQPCSTFNSEVLAREEDFTIIQLEVWKFVETSRC